MERTNFRSCTIDLPTSFSVKYDYISPGPLRGGGGQAGFFGVINDLCNYKTQNVKYKKCV